MSKYILPISLFTFLIITFIVGIIAGRNIKTIREYALGGRNFSTALLVSTITATFIGGGDLFISTYEVYTTGWMYAIGSCGIALGLLLMGYFLIPRMGEFLGTISIADAMGTMYGNKARVISALSSSIGLIGYIAVQFKVLSAVLGYAFPLVPSEYNTFIVALVVITYSAFGGMRSVAFTDLLQFFTFLVVIPLLAVIIWNAYVHDPSYSIKSTPEIFDIKNFLGLKNPNFWGLVFLFIHLIMPEFDPSLFQRISMGKSVFQVQKALTISTITILFILSVLSFIAFCIYSMNPNIVVDENQNAIVYYIIDQYSSTSIGIIALLLIGVVAMSMSSADSDLNAASTIITHDLILVLNTNISEQNKLLILKIINFIIGGIGVILALYTQDMLGMIFVTQSFYMPVVTVPLLFAIFGFRGTQNSVLVSMFTGITTVVIMHIFTPQLEMHAPTIGMALSSIALLLSHHFFSDSSGWIGIQDKVSYNSVITFRKNTYQRNIDIIKNFNFIDFCKKHSPTNDFTYVGFGIFILMISVATTYSAADNLQNDSNLMNIYKIMFGLSFCFITYPIWPSIKNKEVAMQVSWNFVIFLLLPIFGTFFLVKNNFSPMQLVIFTTIILVTLILVRGVLGILMMLLGSSLGMMLFGHLYKEDIILNYGAQDILVYLLLIIGCIFIIFLQPRLKKEKISEFLHEVLREKIKDQSTYLLRTSAYRQEFISRLDKDCIDTFYKLRDQINDIKANLKSGKFKNSKAEKELEKIAEKIATSSEYLLSIINEIEQSYKINASVKPIQEFIKNMVSYTKSLNFNTEVKIYQNVSSNTIECDHELIHKIIKGLVEDGLQHGFDKTKSFIELSLSDTKLKYDLTFTNAFQEIVDAIDINITFKNIVLTPLEEQKLSNKEFRKKFTHWLQIIFTHYGKIKVLPETNKLSYVITIPISLSTVRPKKLDLPDQVAGLFGMMQDTIQEQKYKIKKEIINNLSDLGMNKEIITKLIK